MRRTVPFAVARRLQAYDQCCNLAAIVTGPDALVHFYQVCVLGSLQLLNCVATQTLTEQMMSTK